MAGIHINPSNLAAASASIPKDTPILMLNLLRFRETAAYTNDSDLPVASGKDAYLHRYVPAFQSIAASVDETIQPFWFGAPVAHLIGPQDIPGLSHAAAEEWHSAALIRYPSFQAFRDVTESERYEKEGMPHRLAALEDWRLIATVELTPQQLLGG
jgi:hypothetical protein